MNENLKSFLGAVEADETWMTRLASADREAAVELALKKAAELGMPLAAADFEAPEGELSEDELGCVAGGGVCFCEIGGGGTSEDHGSDGIDEVCACVFGGYGTYEDKKDGSSNTRCVCVQLGSGASYR